MTGIILLCCSVLCGFLAGRYFQRRVLRKNEMLVDVMKYISALKLNVTGKQQELEKFNESFLQGSSKTFREFLSERRMPALSPLQKKRIEDCFANLDCVSGEQLLQHLDFYGQQLQGDLSECAEEAKKSSVYVKLGLLLGAMLGILFL